MIILGKRQKLTIVQTVDFGVYLADPAQERDPQEPPEEKVLLPGRQVPEGAKEGDEIEVFIYRDSKDRLIATVHEPRLEKEQTAVLEVVDTGRIGAFLDWGLEKDLLLPFREQTMPVQKGDKCLVALYEDKSHRLCATMKVYHYLSTQTPYKTGDMVDGRVYELSKNFGVFVAVDDRYSALIPKSEAQGSYKVNDILRLRVTKVKPDGKLNVSARKQVYLQLEEDAQKIFQVLEHSGGTLPLDDKSDPAQIKARLGLSKAAFKRAVGHLMKEGKILQRPGEIVIQREE
ncbi:MAG: S1 RNA-binding domain-containing protein [Lachnospiraceae bacterium]|nr:S1 RNA-binding domain-containing protein [Lachnospiraceae bacterium]